MNNKYRLSSNVFEREKEEEKIEPQKIFFLSVEGNATEKEYFEGISKNRKKLGINARVDVEVLKRSRKDTNSAPMHVVELLEEYLHLRVLDRAEFFNDIPGKLIAEFGEDIIQQYIEDPDNVPQKKKNSLLTRMRECGYDLEYRRYLNKYNGKYDEFCILIDRDALSHSKADMLQCIKHCEEKKYNCYIANPCFEFWLLLHLSDVEAEYKNRITEILENKPISAKHTFVSKQVSDKAHHGKKGIHFESNYLPNVGRAVDRAKKFAGDEMELIHHIGCNLWRLIEKMKGTL